jgi:4-amino-4-deoxy-L-arabinose transferase-like glycosyltransferase
MVRFNQDLSPLPLTRSLSLNTRYLLLFIGLLVIRAFFNAALPLMDQTEARYAEIARLMEETANWVVLQIDYGLPFWAKPPLSTWAAALSLSFFGVSEFSVRLPFFLVCLGLALWMSRYRASKEHPYTLPGLILISIPEYYLHAGVVSTDVFLMLSVVIVMLSFWEALQDRAKTYWVYLFFLGMGLGVLAKGPIIGILTLPPILFWSLRTGAFWKALKSAPWLLGTLLFLIVCIPWYILAELRSPGFLDYFIVGEHFNRYFNSEWKGDKYGFPKQQPFGIIWGFFAAFTLPWMIAAIRLAFRNKKSFKTDPWVLFLTGWMLWPLLFFSSSKSLIHPYILPSIIPFALLITHWWDSLKSQNTYLTIGSLIPLLLVGIYSSGLAEKTLRDNTDKYLIEESQGVSIFSLQHKSYSSQFYTAGKIKQISTLVLKKGLGGSDPFWVLIRKKDYPKLSGEVQSQLKKGKENKKKAAYYFKGKK